MTSKRQKKAGWILPEIVIPDEIPLKTVTLCIPDVPEYVAAFWGTLQELGKWWNWEKSYQPGDTRATEAAELWRYVLYNFNMDGCGCKSNDCGCGTQNITNITNITGVADPPENFDPEDPETWDPDLDPIENPSYDDALCTTLRILIREWDVVRYTAAQAACDGEEIDWTDIGLNFANSITATALTFALWTVVPVPLVSIALAAAGTSLAFSAGDFIEALIGVSSDQCEAGPLPTEVLDAYACCLYDHFVTNGLSITTYETMWDDPCEGAIDYYDILPIFPFIAEEFDEQVRNTFASFTTSIQMYRGFLELMSVIATVPPSALETCEDCIDCPPGNEYGNGIPMFDNPDVTISPAPEFKVWTDGTEYAEWPIDTVVTFTFSERMCFIGCNFSIKRGATSSRPNKLTMIAGGVEVTEGYDISGESNLNPRIGEPKYIRSFKMFIPESGKDGAPAWNIITDDDPRILAKERE